MSQPTVGLPQIFSASDNVTNQPLAGGKLYTYASGTNTPLATYYDVGLTSPCPNPIILDNYGQAVFYLQPQLYRFNLLNANGVQQAHYPEDNIQVVGYNLADTTNASNGAGLVGYNSSLAYGANTVGAGLNAKVNTTDLASTSSVAKGQGLVGFNPSLSYGAGTLPNALASTASGQGAALIGAQQPITGALARIQSLKNTDVVTLRDFCACDGVTDDTAQFQDLCNWSSTTGGTIQGDERDIIRLTSDVVVTGGLKLRGKFTIKQGNFGYGMRVEPARTVSSTVTSITTAQYPAGTGLPAVPVIALTSATGFAKGDVAQLRSADTYPFDATKNKAELVKIADVVSNNVYLSAPLLDTYTTSIVLEQLNPAVVDIDGPVFTYDGNPLSVAVSVTRQYSLFLVGCVNARVRATFRDDCIPGMANFSCWGSDIDVVGRNLRVNYSLAMYGYVVDSSCSSRHNRVRVHATKCGHAYTNGCWTSVTMPIRWGRTADDLVYDSIHHGPLYAGFDTHPGPINTVFSNCAVVGNTTDTDQPTNANSYAFQDRALNTKYFSCRFKDVYGGFYFGASIQNHGTVVNTTEVIGCHFSATSTSGYLGLSQLPIQTSPDTYLVRFKNCVIIGYCPLQNDNTGTILQEFNQCTFMGDKTHNWVAGDSVASYRYSGCAFNEFPQMRMGHSNNITMTNCTRKNSTTFPEALRIGTGSTLTIDNFYHEAPSYGSGLIVLAGYGTESGTVTVYAGALSAYNYPYSVTIGTNGTATLSLTEMNLRHPRTFKSTTANRPSGLTSGDAGTKYFDTTLASNGKPIWWNGSIWVDSTGASV